MVVPVGVWPPLAAFIKQAYIMFFKNIIITAKLVARLVANS